MPPRSDALAPPRFPILTLDERSLTPSMGYVFRRNWLLPCESLVSILWKFERANAVPGHVVALFLGPDVDPYEGVIPQRGNVDVRRLGRTLAVSASTLRASLLEPSGLARHSNLLRHCRSCIALGYHSVLHQMTGLSRCPAHRRPLETACRRCGYEAPYVANVRLLESPYRCARRGASYGGHGWSPTNPRALKAAYRRAITRIYFERCIGPATLR